MTNSFLHSFVIVAVALTVPSLANSDEPASTEGKSSRLRFFNTAIFGTATDKPVVLLRPARPGQLDPETVMVDIDKGRYFAATVRYPKKISFADARKSLNTIYAKHEKESFAAHPNMGLWRNEDDKFSIQLSEDEDNLVVIYIKFSLLTKEKFTEAFSRALRDTENKDKQP